MKKIQINNFIEKIFYEKLDNGLEIYLLPLKNKKNYAATYGIKYGGRNVDFKIGDKVYKTPSGIAHFLEHKMFERDNDPFSFYEKSGTEVNASTSHDYTQYYIFGTSDFENNLEYLINWLKEIDITDELVEKEKGIILEEASMYKDSPVRILNEKIKENVFINDPYRKKVIGSDSDIKKITKEEIELCFNSFYVPNNMFLICVGNFDKDRAIEIIKKNNTKKSSEKVEKIYGNEPDNINKVYEEIEFNIDVPRISVAYKFNKNLFNNLNILEYELDLYLHILISISLGPTSEIREKWIKQNLFLSSMYKITETNTHFVIEFSAISNKPDKLSEELTKYLIDLNIDEDSFEREKKLWISGEVEAISNIQSIKYSIMDDILDYGAYIPNKIEIIKNLNKNLVKIKNLLVFKDKATVKLVPKTKK